MAFEYYLELDGIPGECEAKDYEKTWEVVDLTQGSYHGAGQGVGGYMPTTLTVLKDKGYGNIVKAAISGKHIASGKLTKVITDDKGGKQKSDTWKFTSIDVLSEHSTMRPVEAPGSKRTGESLTISFEANKVEYTGDGGFTFTWDKVKKSLA
jgi:type VI protein secretion system component Hcp